MKIVTCNANGVNGRFPVLLHWLDKEKLMWHACRINLRRQPIPAGGGYQDITGVPV